VRHDDLIVANLPRYGVKYPVTSKIQDHKKLGRIPDGGGHRVLGRELGPDRHKSGLGYDHMEVVIDDHSRLGVVVAVPDESASSAAQALEIAAAEFASHGIAIERVLTDNGWAYTHGPRYAGVIAELGARHKRTRPYRPQTNGKAERFIQTLLNE
jgi:transposase InsO family protein